MARARRPLPVAWFTAVALALAPASAIASDYPSIDGHMTDPQHRLKFSEKEAIEDKLGKIQSDTQTDVAGWIADDRENLKEVGWELYQRWHIGKDWENGVFFVFPISGPVIIVVNPDRPALTPAEVERIMTADAAPSPSLAKRIEKDADEAGAILRVGAKAAKPRPPGTKDPRLAIRYAIAASVIALAAVVLGFVRRRRRPRVAAS
jgi:uncharacterized membrane protein YgcG